MKSIKVRSTDNKDKFVVNKFNQSYRFENGRVNLTFPELNTTDGYNLMLYANYLGYELFVNPIKKKAYMVTDYGVGFIQKVKGILLLELVKTKTRINITKELKIIKLIKRFDFIYGLT